MLLSTFMFALSEELQAAFNIKQKIMITEFLIFISMFI